MSLASIEKIFAGSRFGNLLSVDLAPWLRKVRYNVLSRLSHAECNPTGAIQQLAGKTYTFSQEEYLEAMLQCCKNGGPGPMKGKCADSHSLVRAHRLRKDTGVPLTKTQIKHVWRPHGGSFYGQDQ